MVNRIEIYAHILGYASPEDIDVPALSKKLGISPQSMGAYIRQGKNNPKIPKMMVEAGYNPGKFGQWVAKMSTVDDKKQKTRVGGRFKQSRLSTKHKQTNAEGPLLSLSNKEENFVVGNISSPLLPTSSGSASTTSTSGTGFSGEEQAMDLPSAMEQDLESKGFKKMADGTFARPVVSLDGNATLETYDPSRIKSSNERISEEVSALTFDHMTIHVNQLVRKIGMNPSVYQLYNWAMNKVNPDGRRLFAEDADIGDFVSWCVRFAMKAAFGVEPGIFIHPTNLIELATQSRNPQGDFIQQ